MFLHCDFSKMIPSIENKDVLLLSGEKKEKVTTIIYILYIYVTKGSLASEFWKKTSSVGKIKSN